MEKFFTKEDMQKIGKMLFVLVGIVAIYFGIKSINEIKTFGSIGLAPSTVHTIDVTGEGEAVAVPNIATETFTVTEKAKTVAEAQDSVNKKIAASLSFLKQAGVEEKDIKTTDYTAYPEYSYPCTGTAPCSERSMKQPELIGYTVSQTIAVKIRDTSAVGKIIDGLGASGATGLSGPNYTVDNPQAVKDDAREKAIVDAKEKAEVLAKQLGVRLVRIAHYSENAGGGAYPTTYMAKDMGVGGASTEAQVPMGENKYTSNVTITYEIR